MDNFLLRHARAALACSFVIASLSCSSGASAAPQVIVNEIAWMGSINSSSDEWIELYNTASTDVSLEGWTLSAQDGTPAISLHGIVPAGGYFLLERTDDTSVPGINADQIYTGALENGGEVLELFDASGALVDSVASWYAGVSADRASMERTTPGNALDWNTATQAYAAGLGTPGALNSQTTAPPPSTREQINTVSDAPGAINVYFNKGASTGYATSGNLANFNVNLENRLRQRILAATRRIDVATYEINLPGIVDALLDRAAGGVQVRIIADAKDPAPTDTDRTSRYALMRLNLEKLLRGRDGLIGTADDAALFSDSAILAVEDSATRTGFGLPATPTGMVQKAVAVGSASLSGYLLADAEQKTGGGYYAADNQMHNKFLVIDDTWVWTGSWNFTVTGLYGSEANQQAGILGGNTQHAVEVHSTELAAAFVTEFNEMWGGAGQTPDPQAANFHARKSDNTPHVFSIGNRRVELYFSPGDDAVGNVTQLVRDQADLSAYFSIFAWSDQGLVDELKFKWEGSKQDLQGSLTGFDVKGVYDASFWNQWWSASIEMTGRTASRSSVNNPNIRWANPAPVFIDAEERKLHSKTLLIDACSASDPSVVVGSTNWSANGNNVNDENLLIIHDAAISNQFLQEFYARYQQAGGTVPSQAGFSCP